MKPNKFPTWLVPIKLSKKLKKIGFDAETLFLYNEEEPKDPKIYLGLENEDVDALDIEIDDLYFYSEADMESYECILPTWEQVFEWFRKKGLFSYIDKLNLAKNKEVYKFYVKGKNNIISDSFSSYEESRVALVNKLIKIHEL